MAITWISVNDTHDPTNPKAVWAVEAACWILYKLTAEKYPGVTTRTEWYGLEHSCVSCIDLFVENSQSYLPNHRHIWYTLPEVRRIRLRGYPVRTITSVSVNGEVLPPNAYRVEGKKYLTRTNGMCWSTSSGVEVVYTAGINPPRAGQEAAIRLANEFILAVTDPASCALPERVTNVSRQGVDYTLLDAQDFLEEGRTGIYEVDLFIKAANPINAKKKPRIFSVDLPSGTTRM